MKTAKLISTISFNTPSFVQGTVARLLESELITYSHWIQHKPEQGDNKEHIHLVIEPAKALDTLFLSKEFIQPIPNDKPLKTLPWNKSKISDWILYSLHHSGYLATKFQTREIEYQLSDIQSTDRDLLEAQYNEAIRDLNPLVDFVKQWYEKGRGLNELILTGAITPQNLMFATAIYQACHNKKMQEQARERDKAEKQAVQASIEWFNRKLEAQGKCAATATRCAGFLDFDEPFKDDEPPPF